MAGGGCVFCMSDVVSMGKRISGEMQEMTV